MNKDKFILIGVDLGNEKDCQSAILNLYYNETNHIIFETNDEEQVKVLNEILEEINKEKTELQRLEAIDNAKPSEALSELESFINNITFAKDIINQKQQLLTNITTIKQALQRLETIKNTKKDINSLYSNMHQTSDELDKSLKDSLLKNAKIEAIDNSNPSEALKCLEEMGKYSIGYGYVEELKQFEPIKQALIKAQEQEKEKKIYLKWEDLYFNDDEQRMKVSLNGSIHHLCYYRSIFGYVCIIDNTDIIIREENKNFFNDLHLERV